MGFGGESDEAGFGPDDDGGGYGAFGGSEDSDGWGDDGGFGGGGFADEFAPGPLGGFSFGGWDDPGTGTNWGNVGFGPGGTAYGGEGFEGFDSDISQYLSKLPAVEQERLFRTLIEPTLNKIQGWQGKVASKVASTVIAAVGNAVFPGLGSLAKITGFTGYVADRLVDDHTAQALGEALGIRDSVSFDTDPGSKGADIIKKAVAAGKTPDQILMAMNQTFRSQGDEMGTWDNIWGAVTGSGAADTATSAAGTAASYQQQALNYLQSREAVPLEISSGAMQELGGLYGLPGGTGDQGTFINQAKQSPLYQGILAGRGAGEDAIMRQAGMTGGLRSGNVNQALYDYNTQLENKALMGAYGERLGGLQYLAGMQPGGAANIANAMSGIGGTLAEGQIAAGQAEQQGIANMIGLGGTVYNAVGGIGGIVDTGKDIWDTVSGWF